MVTRELALCQKCGVNRELIREMLNEPNEDKLESENRTIARAVIASCKECKHYFKHNGGSK